MLQYIISLLSKNKKSSKNIDDLKITKVEKLYIIKERAIKEWESAKNKK